MADGFLNVNVDIPIGEFRERGRKRRAAMKLGTELTQPEVLEQFTDPQLRNVMAALGSSLAAGDLQLDEAATFLGGFPARTFQQPMAVPPEVLEMLQGGTATGKLTFGPEGLTAEVEPFREDIIRATEEAKETPAELEQKRVGVAKTEEEIRESRARREQTLRKPAPLFGGGQRAKNIAVLRSLLEGKPLPEVREDLQARINAGQIDAESARRVLKLLFPQVRIVPRGGSAGANTLPR
jgi:hypothetical protein